MEKICFELENIKMNFLDKEILNVERLAIHQFDRIGIVGKNGAGKSTLLKIIANKLDPAQGIVKRYVAHGYLEQLEMPTTEKADPTLIGKLAVPLHSEQLSGGEQTKLKLAQLFTHYHEALLIDEPTTHLDQEGISFLMEELRYYYGPLLLISHDRAVLDELVTTIWEIRDSEVYVYSGNYSEYAAQKQLELEQQEQAYEQFMKEKNRLEKAAQDKIKNANKIIQAGNTANKKAKEKPNRMFETKSKGTSQKSMYRAAKAIEQRIEQLQEMDAVQGERQIIFHQSKTLALHNKFPIMADRLTLQVKDTVLLDDISFQIPLGKKIAITGNNGSGKSTLLQLIANNGTGLTISPKAKMGTFYQMSYQFPNDETVLESVKKGSQYDEGFLRSVLHAMQFVGTDIQKNVRSLSGGESIRLQLCQLFLGDYNILLLDEPNNFLDLHAIKALETFITAYQGTVIFVSHDQAFIKNVADMQWKIADQKLTQI